MKEKGGVPGERVKVGKSEKDWTQTEKQRRLVFCEGG